MTQSAVAFKDTFNGYEQRTDGLWVHRGRAEVASMRVGNSPVLLQPRNGAGVEVLWDPTVPVGAIQSYDRDVPAWRDLNINARNINLVPQGGKLGLPAGSAQAPIGSYSGAVTTSSAVTGTWIITPFTTGAIACSGALLRIEATTVVFHSVAGGGILLGIAADGAPWLASIAMANCPVANQALPITMIGYAAPSAALHTFAIMYDNLTAGTANVGHTFMYTTLYVTEQRA